MHSHCLTKKKYEKIYNTDFASHQSPIRSGPVPCWSVNCCFQLVLLYFAVKLLSHVQLFATPRTAAQQAPLSSTVSQNLLRFASTESVMLSISHPLLPPSPFAFSFSQSFFYFTLCICLQEEIKIEVLTFLLL